MNKNTLFIFLNGRRRSFSNAFMGLFYALKTQVNVKIHFCATILVIGCGIYFRISNIEFAIILLCISTVWISEILNTSLEKMVDLCTPNYHPLAKIVKDLAAGAVLISAIFAASIGVILFLPYFLLLIRH